MKSPYERRIARAATLAAEHPSAGELLSFYSELAKFQKRIFDQLTSSDVRGLLRWFPDLFDVVAKFSPPVAGFAQEHLATDAARVELLAQCWEGDADEPDARAQFLGHALLEPFAAHLASRGPIDVNANVHWTNPVCPFCGSRPGLAVLRGEGDGGKRSLLCSLCATEWQFRRILCPNCGEENKETLPVYIASQFDYVRVEACDTCKTYLKSIDLTKNGLADPVVDEIATVPLNIWAEEHGYVKLAPNLMGM